MTDREIAEGASEYEDWVLASSGKNCVTEEGDLRVFIGGLLTCELPREVAEHIAHFNPAKVLGMLDETERLRAKLDNRERECRHLRTEVEAKSAHSATLRINKERG